MLYSSVNKFAVLQETESPKRNKPSHRNKTSHQKSRTHKHTPSKRNHRASVTNQTQHSPLRQKIFRFTSFDDILNGISVCGHSGCHNNSCCSIHCDLVHCQYQSSHLRISIHLANLSLTDSQLITLTQQKIIPLITNFITNQKEKCENSPFFDQHTLQRVVIAAYLGDNALSGPGCVPLLEFMDTSDFRLSALQLYKNSLHDAGYKAMCDVFERMKYPPNEIHLSYNQLTNIAFNATMDCIKARHDNPNLLSYPLRAYKIKFGPLMQDVAPLWLRMDHNHIDSKEAGLYMKAKGISGCYAGKYKPKKKQNAEKMTLACDPMHCIDYKTVNYYQKQLDQYREQHREKENKKKYQHHSNAKCQVCTKARKKGAKGKVRGTKVVLCKRCREKAKLIREEEKSERALAAKVDTIMTNKKLNIDEKIEAMEALSREQDMENKTEEEAFRETVVKPTAAKAWVWGKDDSEGNNDSDPAAAAKEDKEKAIRPLFADEFFMQSVCRIPDNFEVPMVHLYRFSSQLQEAKINEKVAMAQTLLLSAEHSNEEDGTQEKRKKGVIEEKIENNLPIANANESKNHIGFNRKEYETNMVRLSETPLFIMCDTCSILRMVALQKKSVMNYWETMLTHAQKMKYILHFTIRDALQKTKFLSSSEMYQRTLRLEILPKLQLHLNTDEIKSIAHDLMQVPFKKLLNEKQKRARHKKKYETYLPHKHKDIVICHMYRFVALFGDTLPDEKAERHLWQQVMEKHVFHELGFECPQDRMPRFITEIRKLTKQYEYQNKLESAKRFTLGTLIEKAENAEFGFNNATKSEQCCILIPHTVAMELEHIKTARGKKSKGDLWRVQQLCGAGGLLESLCKKCGCDVLGSEDGEAHVSSKSGNNDYTIISVAEHYSKLLNTQRNLGFVLLTNDKAMYTIASGKGVPVVSLNTLNAKLQQKQMKEDGENNGNKEWNASYMRQMFIDVGFVGGFAKKYLINDAVNVLQNTTARTTAITATATATAKESELSTELDVRRQQVAAYMNMEEAYASELFASMTLTNELLVTLKDVFQNNDSVAMMKQVYKNKVDNLERTVRQTHKRWSAIIEEFQSRQVKKGKEKENEIETKQTSTNDACDDIYLVDGDDDDDGVPEMQTLDAEDRTKVHGNDVEAYNRSGQNNKNNKNENDMDSDTDTEMPPPLNATEQQQLFDIKEKKKENTSGFNHNVPLIGGYVAGEELFSRQANNGGFQEEVVIMTQET